MITPVTNTFSSPGLVLGSRPKSYCDRIKTIPVIGHIIRAIIWLFKKIFPCCCSSETPLPLASIKSKANNVKITPIDFNRFSGLPVGIDGLVLSNFGTQDLAALDIALRSSKSGINTNRWQQAIEKNREKIILQEDLAEIFDDHPEWEDAVDGWNGVSLEDKVWLLRLYELHQLPCLTFYLSLQPPQRQITIPKISAFFPNQTDQNSHNPSLRTPELLNSRKEIEKFLCRQKELTLNRCHLKKCPKAIALLYGLKVLDLALNDLGIPPDVSRLTKLEKLHLDYNKLEEPPYVRKNPNLKELTISHNELTIPPDVTQNKKLEKLYLGDNKLKKPPNVSHNKQLKQLCLVRNQLETLPDLTQNKHLKND